MTVTVSGRTLKGTAKAPASKSVVHRLLICAALCDRPTIIEDVTLSEDITATARSLKALGAHIDGGETVLAVTPMGSVPTGALLDCGESGSTLRFLLPIAAALGGAAFTGRERLAERPLSPLYELLADNGCVLSPSGRFPLTVGGRLCGERFTIDGGVSSQFISGLLMAAPLLGHSVEIDVTGKIESRPYMDMTVDAMRRFGVSVTETDATFRVSGAYRSPGRLAAEADWSNAAFWLVAKAILPSDDLAVAGLDPLSLQGARAVATIIEKTNGLTMPFDIDAAQTPALVPILAVLAAAIPGRSVIGNARRLRLKESDRLESVGALLKALGGSVTIGEDSLVIDGTGRLKGGTVDACNDHRIAMAAAVAACIADGEVTINGAEAVRKSYPHFFEQFAERGTTVCHRYSENA